MASCFTWGRVWPEASADTRRARLALPSAREVLPDAGFSAAACGHKHTLLLTREGALWSSGANREGQLGRRGEGVAPARRGRQDREREVAVAVEVAVTARGGARVRWGLRVGGGGDEAQATVGRGVRHVNYLNVLFRNRRHFQRRGLCTVSTEVGPPPAFSISLRWGHRETREN